MSRVHTRGGTVAAMAVVLAAVTSAAVPAVAAGSPQPPTTPMGGGKAALKAPPHQRAGVVPGTVIVTLDAKTTVTGRAVAGARSAARTAQTDSAPLNARLRAVGAGSLRPLLPAPPSGTAAAVTGAARARLGPGASDVSRTYVLTTRDRDAAAVARELRGTPGVVFAEPDRYVNTMNSGAQPLPLATVRAAAGSAPAKAAKRATAATGGLPANYALSTSAQAFLNAGGVDAAGAFATLGTDYGRLPGAGEVVTNVSIGDLTDQSMADGGDAYVRRYGPTTVVKDGRRYLDLPSMPLIPTYVAQPDGGLDAGAATEDQDPSLGEVMLDFGVMAPLPHDRQRADNAGSGYTDLLGIAPGARYRLVVPQQPTFDQVANALLAAAHQSPRPNVITASLGFGTDGVGFPGRYLEDDPYIRSVVASIVHDGIVVSISSNDGTRLYTPTAVGPDGGSTPTDLAPNASAATSIDDDALSTTPTRVPDSGAIAAGGTTLDDTLAAPAGSPRSRGATVAETRISGFGTFSSGFGSRVDLSAPSDNILSFVRPQGSDPHRSSPQNVDVILEGGTSASAPEIAAAAAVVQGAAHLAGRDLGPAQVRDLLERTGRAVPSPSQIDRTLHVGPQIDVTAATEAALGRTTGGHVGIVRLSVAHRVTIGGLGGEFLETTDQNRIDLGDAASGGDGEGLVGPVTVAGDVTGLPTRAGARYVLRAGSTRWTSTGPAIRVTPRQLLAAAGLPVVAAGDRSVRLTYQVVLGARVVASADRTLTIGPSDGRYAEATAPAAPATAPAGRPVTVGYDLSNVMGTDNPQLVVSTVGHWNPVAGPIFTPAWHQALTSPTGKVTIPASAFHGGGLYGIGVVQSRFGGNPQFISYGEFAPIRIAGGTADARPAAPLITGKDGAEGHAAEVTRAAPSFALRYDVRGIRGATSARVELSAPAPTNYGSFNTFTNANGTRLDDDGVDAPSSAHAPLRAASGSVRLNALTLGLGTSNSYDVRVLALDAGHHVVGQASPVSTLQVDDGLTPDGSTVIGFAADGDDSLAALRTAAGGTTVVRYSTRTGGYGAALTSDAGDGSDYDVLGVAPAEHRALLAHKPAPYGDVRVETWDTATGSLVGSTTLPAADYTYVTGLVDLPKNRGAILAHRVSDHADVVLPVDLGDGTAAAPIAVDTADVRAGSYSVMTADPATGALFLGAEATPLICAGSVAVPEVDLTTGGVTTAGTATRCSDGLASDHGTLYNLSVRSWSANIVPTSTIQEIDEATGADGDGITLRRDAAAGNDALAVDGAHGLALTLFSRPEGTAYFGAPSTFVPDDNATGQVRVSDVRTGATVRILSGFQFADKQFFSVTGAPGLPHALNSVQLDPATRTGWTYGPYRDEIQQFSY